MPKKMLKGFNHLFYNILAANTDVAYTPGNAYVRVHGAQTLTQSDTANELKVQADDGVYYQENEFQEGELQITVAGLALTDLAALKGSDSATDELTEGELDNAPEVALSFSGLLADGEGYRCYQYFACKLSAWKADLATKGQNNSVAAVTLTFKYHGRAIDRKLRAIKDVATETLATAYLQAIPSLPTGG